MSNYLTQMELYSDSSTCNSLNYKYFFKKFPDRNFSESPALRLAFFTVIVLLYRIFVDQVNPLDYLALSAWSVFNLQDCPNYEKFKCAIKI
ncbi:hypothetical protein BES34_012565 [Leptospira inadai serovar Lyme]|nr:hypothetical protein BES34_012565 [Leptospira inadai serovar Lyme]